MADYKKEEWDELEDTEKKEKLKEDEDEDESEEEEEDESEEEDKDEKETTYDMELTCTNCGETNEDIKIPNGMLVKEFVKDRKCEYCKCENVLERGETE